MLDTVNENKYQGLTYPKAFDNRTVHWFFKKFMCPKGKHLLDECWSPHEWYFSCDACGLEIHIRKVDKKYCALREVGNA